MTRCALLLSAALIAVPLAARAQSPAPASAPVGQSQLDRIEGKLDEVLRRLDQLHPQPSGAVPGQATPSGVSNPSPAPGEPPAPALAAYKPGAVAVAHPAPKDVNSLSEIPADDVGGFVYTGGPIALTDIRTRGVRYAGPVGAEIQGWLRAKEAGCYQIGTDLNAHFGSGPCLSRPASCKPVWKAALLTSAPSLSAIRAATTPTPPLCWEPSYSPAYTVCASGPPAQLRKASPPPQSCC